MVYRVCSGLVAAGVVSLLVGFPSQAQTVEVETGRFASETESVEVETGRFPSEAETMAVEIERFAPETETVEVETGSSASLPTHLEQLPSFQLPLSSPPYPLPLSSPILTSLPPRSLTGLPKLKHHWCKLPALTRG